jgi:hypothetical protein
MYERAILWLKNFTVGTLENKYRHSLLIHMAEKQVSVQSYSLSLFLFFEYFIVFIEGTINT